MILRVQEKLFDRNHEMSFLDTQSKGLLVESLLLPQSTEEVNACRDSTRPVSPQPRRVRRKTRDSVRPVLSVTLVFGNRDVPLESLEIRKNLRRKKTSTTKTRPTPSVCLRGCTRGRDHATSMVTSHDKERKKKSEKFLHK